MRLYLAVVFSKEVANAFSVHRVNRGAVRDVIVDCVPSAALSHVLHFLTQRSREHHLLTVQHRKMSAVPIAWGHHAVSRAWHNSAAAEAEHLSETAEAS